MRAKAELPLPRFRPERERCRYAQPNISPEMAAYQPSDSS